MDVKSTVEVMLDGKPAYLVSKELGFGKNTIDRWKNGESVPRVDDFDKFLQHCGYRLDIKSNVRIYGLR